MGSRVEIGSLLNGVVYPPVRMKDPAPLDKMVKPVVNSAKSSADIARPIKRIRALMAPGRSEYDCVMKASTVGVSDLSVA